MAIPTIKGTAGADTLAGTTLQELFFGLDAFRDDHQVECVRKVDDRGDDGLGLRVGVEAEDASEFMLRMILSLLTVAGPRERSAARQRDYLRVFVAGALVRTG